MPVGTQASVEGVQQRDLLGDLESSPFAVTWKEHTAVGPVI
jgi:hypothetical protein